MTRVETIVSGGQTGADRAALDFAIEHGIPHGGWCPKGRLAEDGIIAPHYQLRETPSASYPQRTEWNVRDSDATAIISIGRALKGGSKKTLELAQKLGRPSLHISRDSQSGNPGGVLRSFVAEHGVKVLNIVGPRASEEPAIAPYVQAVLNQAFTPVSIFIVQKHKDMPEHFRKILENDNPNFKIHSFRSPSLALRSFHVRGGEARLLITGMIFSDSKKGERWNGAKLIRQCKQTNPNLKVLVSTYFHDDWVFATCGGELVEPDAVLRKPFEPNQLLESVDDLVYELGPGAKRKVSEEAEGLRKMLEELKNEWPH